MKSRWLVRRIESSQAMTSAWMNLLGKSVWKLPATSTAVPPQRIIDLRTSFLLPVKNIIWPAVSQL
ncbi:MAG: hypothetical protein KDB05_04400 [Planctomycetales bacterium]|nr:hypothetical protein [Planctomycetales bacterium]